VRIVTMHEDGVLELNASWLPLMMAQNFALMRKLEDQFKEKFQEYSGLMSTPMVLDQIHNWVIDTLAKEYPMPGVADYLRGIEKVPMEGNDVPKPIHAETV